MSECVQLVLAKKMIKKENFRIKTKKKKEKKQLQNTQKKKDDN